MPGFSDDEPKTVRIKTKREDEAEGLILDPDVLRSHAQARAGRDHQHAAAAEGAGLNEQELFEGLKAMIPFFFELELPAESGQALALVSSDDPPPFIAALREDARGGARALQTQRRAAALKELEIPFCGLLGCYQPASASVVVYTQGINWVLSTFEQDFLDALPQGLSGRPLRELYIQDPDQMRRAMRIYLRWLLRELTILHGLGHVLVHLARFEGGGWKSASGFESLPVKVHEHLAQSIVATALTMKEIAAPFPRSDLAAVFNRLSLNLPAYGRAWAFGLPWSGKEEVAGVLRAVRQGQSPIELATL